MRRGFTLIELLAVIVILAAIALIATPIVLSIINDTEKSAVIRSAEFYISAVENKIMQENMKLGGMLNPSECIINTDGNVTCDGTPLEIEVNGDKPDNGYIRFENGRLRGVKVGFGESTIVKNLLGEYVSLEEDVVCVGVTTTNKTTGNIPTTNFVPGDEYICEVKRDTSYRFFVLSTDGDKINLIMEKNLVTKNNIDSRKFAIWNDDGQFTNGPVVAMDSLYEATKDWNKVSNIEINYTDEGIKENAYGGVKTNGDVTTIFNKSGQTTGSYKNLKARMPYYSEVTASIVEKGQTVQLCGTANASCKLWIVNFTSEVINWYGESTVMSGENTGYWLMSTSPPTSSGPNRAYYVYGKGFIGGTIGSTSFPYTVGPGIRPVITIEKSQIYLSE